jgi:hypothetical protein
MYSNSTLVSRFGCLAVIGGAIAGCGSPDAPAATTAGALATEQVFVVDSHRDSIDHGSVVVFALDFSTRRRETVAGDPQLDSVHPLPGSMTGCGPENEEASVAAMGSDLHPRDSGYVGTVSVELSSATHAPDPASTMCFAVHTRGGRWTWQWRTVPITIDYGSPEFTGQPGAGHFDLDVSTDDVDLIAFTMGYGREALTRVTYSAIPPLR